MTMFLYQRAFSLEDKENEPLNHSVPSEFVWRNHWPLQKCIDEITYILAEEQVPRWYIGVTAELTMQDIKKLEKKVKNKDLPFYEGWFIVQNLWQKFIVKKYRDYDLQFCKWAKKEIKAWRNVYYQADW